MNDIMTLVFVITNHFIKFRSDSDDSCSVKSNQTISEAVDNSKYIDLTGKSFETTLKNPRAWSPVRSVGSVVSNFVGKSSV